MLFKEPDEVAHFGFVRRKFARVFGDLDKSVAVPRLLYFGKEKVQFYEIDMLDFIAPPSTNCRADMNAGT